MLSKNAHVLRVGVFCSLDHPVLHAYSDFLHILWLTMHGGRGIFSREKLQLEGHVAHIAAPLCPGAESLVCVKCFAVGF